MSFRKLFARLTLYLGTGLILLGAPATSGLASLGSHEKTSGPTDIRFDPATSQTRFAGRVTPNLCFTLVLPQEWRLAAGEDLRTVLSGSDGAELEVILRSARDIEDRPEPDLAKRDAALLQRDHESLLGRPAQSVSLTSLSSGATRWTAIWVDASLPSNSYTAETFIVPLSSGWLMELSLANLGTQSAYEALAGSVLSSLELRQGADCRRDNL